MNSYILNLKAGVKKLMQHNLSRFTLKYKINKTTIKKLLVIFSSVLLFASCKKDDECSTAKPSKVATASETAYLQSYLNANSITNAVALQGMFYSIDNFGANKSPNLCSSITVNYTGNLINGTSTGAQFDASTAPVTFALNGLIDAWQLVLPLVKTGGTVTLYVPPTLGYGSTAQNNGSGGVVIPASSYLKFVITLVSTN